MNWDDTRVFLAVEREKTLRGAARTLNLDQATVGRRITALEHALRATLFLRTSEGYALTAGGEARPPGHLDAQSESGKARTRYRDPLSQAGQSRSCRAAPGSLAHGALCIEC